MKYYAVKRTWNNLNCFTESVGKFSLSLQAKILLFAFLIFKDVHIDLALYQTKYMCFFGNRTELKINLPHIIPNGVLGFLNYIILYIRNVFSDLLCFVCVVPDKGLGRDSQAYTDDIVCLFHHTTKRILWLLSIII